MRRQHVSQSLFACFLEYFHNFGRSFAQRFQAQENAISVIICNLLLAQSRPAQVQNGAHYQHSSGANAILFDLQKKNHIFKQFITIITVITINLHHYSPTQYTSKLV